MKEITDKFIALARSEKKHDKARSFFLDKIKGDYNSLLWKCYFSHMIKKEGDCKKKERIALLGSSNILPVKDMLWSVFHANNISTEYYIGEYGNYSRELISDTSGLRAFKPTITLIMLSIQDIVPFIYEDPFSYNAETLNNTLIKAAKGLSTVLTKYSSELVKNTTYIAIIPTNENPCNYVYSQGREYKSDSYLLMLEDAIWRLGKENIILLNTRGISNRYPVDKIEDRRYWYLGKIRYAEFLFSEIAKETINLYKMINFPSKKCLILDLDNTLWGGVVGQDGLENIILGQDGLGKAFQDFQREILKLYKKGVMLAICSKNNEADAAEVFEKHSEMILKRDYFVSQYINWNDKVTNIKKIAKELNIGLDSIVFFDDDPAERKWVRDNLPQVAVPDLPEDQFLYTDFLKNSSWFSSYKLSEEDLARNATYKAIVKVKDMKTTSGDEETFLKGLNQSVILENLNASTLSRAVQLCQKTNQFNLTTKRYQASDLKEIMSHKHNHIYTVKVKDCFCDYGIVGLLILKDLEKEGKVSIDTFLLSCRIIGRKLEYALLDWLKGKYKKKGYGGINGLYSRTDRNGVCAKIYVLSGFTPVTEDKEESRYFYDLGGKPILSRYDRLISIISKKG